MSFECRLPDAYRSVDFKTFEAIYKIVLGAVKKDIDNLTTINNPSLCVEHLLPLLAAKVGMPYFTETLPYVNRQILKNWWWAIQHKGTEASMKMMACFAIMSFITSKEGVKSMLSYLSSVEVFLKRYTTRTVDSISVDEFKIKPYIEVLYESLSTVSTQKQEERLLQFLNLVRPAGWKIMFKPAAIVREGGDGKGLVIISSDETITQTEAPYIDSTVMNEYPDSGAAGYNEHYGVDFSEIVKEVEDE